MPYVATSLGRLFVQPVGSGPVITFWPCFLGDSSLWQAPVAALRRHARTVAVDGPSHGRSEALCARFTLEQCADAWVEALDALGLREPAIFCGLSWGSMVAMRVALRHPGRVRALALFSTIATAPRPAAAARFLTFALALRTMGLTARMHAQLEPMMVSPATRSRSPSMAHDLLVRQKGVHREALYQGAMAILVRPSAIVDELWQIRVPTLVVSGRHDRTTPPGCGRLVARAIEHSELVQVDTGHLVPLEAPEEAAQLLRDFVRKVDAAQGAPPQA